MLASTFLFRCLLFGRKKIYFFSQYLASRSVTSRLMVEALLGASPGVEAPLGMEAPLYVEAIPLESEPPQVQKELLEEM